MRVIIIEDKDAIALLEQLELEKFKIKESHPRGNTPEDFHRRFHYIVTRWLQEQGCKGIR